MVNDVRLYFTWDRLTFFASEKKLNELSALSK